VRRSAPSGVANRARSVWPTAGLLLLVCLAHSSALTGGFVWDDDDYILNNPVLREPGGLARIWFDLGATPQYYPLVFTTFWLETRLWGFAPFGFHLVNVALHAATTVLLWRLLRALHAPGAWLGAALFGVHPVTVESVAWITERKNTLSGLFLVGAVLAYLRAANLGSARRAPAFDGKMYALAALLFVCALCSKTVTAVFPGLLALLLWWKRDRLSACDLWPLAPFVALGAGAGALTLWIERNHVGARGADWALSFLDRVGLAGSIFWFYVGKLAAPIDLSFVYPRWTIDPSSPRHWLGPLAFVVLVVALVAMRRRHPERLGRGVLVAVLAFAGCLFPALGFFDVYPMRYSWVADHFQYHASACLLALAGAGFACWGNRVQGMRLGAVLLVVLAGLTLQRGRVYSDIETLWRDTLARNPGAWMAQHNLGLLYAREGRLGDALASYEAALAIRPDLGQTHYNLGSVHASQGRFDQALVHLEQAARLEPTLLEARNNLGNVLVRLGRYDEAIVSYREALRLEPGYLSAQRNLAHALALRAKTAAWSSGTERP